MSREKPDFYTQKAKKEGYPARSVYKLQELDGKFQLISKGNKILDVGCAPGSWSLYVLRKLGKSGTLVGVDLTPMTLSTPSNAHFLTGDVFSQEIQSKLMELGSFQLIISDAAPKTTGNRTVDSGRSYSLCQEILSLAPQLLEKGGDMVMKIFQGGDEKELKTNMQGIFSTVKILRPKAVRKESFETYLVGKSKK